MLHLLVCDLERENDLLQVLVSSLVQLPEGCQGVRGSVYGTQCLAHSRHSVSRRNCLFVRRAVQSLPLSWRPGGGGAHLMREEAPGEAEERERARWYPRLQGPPQA